MKRIFIFLFLFFSFSVHATTSEPDIVIVTMADLHGQVEPTYEFENENLVEIGGFSRLQTGIKEIKAKYSNVLLMATGDYLAEDFKYGKFYYQFKGKAIFSLMNELNIDVATLGNHDFDFGADATISALSHCQFPIVMSNVDFQKPISNCHNDYIIQKNGFKIGFIGLMTSALEYYQDFGCDISQITLDKNLADLTRKKIKKFKEQDKVDIVVVLSHLGLKEDKKLASEVSGIDIICGGHSHDKFEKGEEKVFFGIDNKKTIIVYPDAYTKHLGVLKLWIQNDSFIHEWDLIKMDNMIVKDNEMELKIENFANDLNNDKEVLVKCTSMLDTRKQTIRKNETAIGNLIADLLKEKFSVDCALITSDSIRGGKIIPPRNLHLSDIISMFPFEAYPIILKIKGQHIKQALEEGVSKWPDPSHDFFQVSGLKYSFQKNVCENDSRIINVEIIQKDGNYLPIEEDKEYVLVTNIHAKQNNFLLDKGIQKYISQDSIQAVVLEALKDKVVISPKIEKRIQILEE